MDASKHLAGEQPEMTFAEAAVFPLPFGKYRGKPIDSVPLTYLDWLNGQEIRSNSLRIALDVYFADPAIQKALNEELEADERSSEE